MRMKVAVAIGMLLVAAFLFCCGWATGCRHEKYKAELAASKADAVYAQKLAEAQQEARNKEAEWSRKLNDLAQQYEQDKKDAQAAYDRTVADLRAGNVRLRRQWQCSSSDRLSVPSGGPGKPDATTDDRAESAGRIVRAADEADAQIRALQEVLRKERQ